MENVIAMKLCRYLCGLLDQVFVSCILVPHLMRYSDYEKYIKMKFYDKKREKKKDICKIFLMLLWSSDGMAERKRKRECKSIN